VTGHLRRVDGPARDPKRQGRRRNGFEKWWRPITRRLKLLPELAIERKRAQRLWTPAFPVNPR
jgi:hypothetical protein